MSKKKKIIIACSLLLAACCLFVWNYAMGPSTKGVGDAPFTAEQIEQMRKELRSQGLPVSPEKSKEFEY